jgi:phosphate/sulfate permease
MAQNAFGSSVAAKSLTLAQAIVIASTFEFLGAVSIGQAVTGTIRNKIIDQDVYEDRPDLLMFGMVCWMFFWLCHTLPHVDCLHNVALPSANA